MAKGVKFDIKAQNKTDAAFKSVKGNLKSITGGLGGMKTAMLGIGAAVGGVYALGKGISVVTKAAMAQRDAENKLNSVLEATGHAAGFTLPELKKMASGLQDVTTYGDETILSGMSILATFKNIRGEGFERTTKAALDMSTILKTDMKSSMIMLGKALNEPKTGLTALTRAGVTFSDQQKEQIKTMVEAGDVVGAQTIILKELESQFGGAAEKAGGPFDKALKQLKNTFGDLLEEVGFAIVDNEQFAEVLRILKEYVADLIPVVTGLVQRFFDWLGPIDQLRGKLDMFLHTVKTMLWPLQQAWNLMKLVGKGIGIGAAMAVTGVEKITGNYDTGTGPAGLPRDGLFYGHQGEIVMDAAESSAARSGAGAGRINITIAPTFMSGDRNAAREVAREIGRELNQLNIRWGTA